MHTYFMFTAHVIHLHGNKFAVVCAELLMIMIMINNVCWAYVLAAKGKQQNLFAFIRNAIISAINSVLSSKFVSTMKLAFNSIKSL